MASTSQRVVQCGDEAELYRCHHHDLVRSVARAVSAPRELIEDACQVAWLILLRRQPERGPTLLGWLRTVAIHEAYRLSRLERRDGHLEDLGACGAWDEVVSTRAGLEDAVEARRALDVLAGLPERQREYLSLLVAGFSYREIAELSGGRTLTNVNKHLAKARDRVRRHESTVS